MLPTRMFSGTVWTSQESCIELLQEARDQRACWIGSIRAHLHLLQDAMQELLSVVLAPIPPAAVVIACRPQEPAHTGKPAQDLHISSVLLLPMCPCIALLQVATSRAPFI